jgi:hypothetical protein
MYNARARSAMWMSAVERDLGADKLSFLKAIGVNHLDGDDVRGFGFEQLGHWGGRRSTTMEAGRLV